MQTTDIDIDALIADLLELAWEQLALEQHAREVSRKHGLHYRTLGVRMDCVRTKALHGVPPELFDRLEAEGRVSARGVRHISRDGEPWCQRTGALALGDGIVIDIVEWGRPCTHEHRI